MLSELSYSWLPDIPLPDALEIVDARNRPLLVMPCGEALQQQLPHRAVALLVQQGRQFLLLRRRDIWDVAAFAPLPAGESCQMTAQALQAHLALPPGPLRQMALLAPTASVPCFVALFVLRLKKQSVLPAADGVLRIDADALAGLQAMPDAPLSPLVRSMPPQLLADAISDARAAARRNRAHAAA